MPSARFFAGWSVFVLATYVAVGSTAQFLHLAWGLWFSEVFLFAGLAVIGWQLSRLQARPAFGMTRFEGRSFGLGLAYGALNYVAWALPLMALAEVIFPKAWIDTFDSSKLFERHSQLEVYVAIAGATLAAPFCEELFFRGFLQRGFKEAPRGIVMTALIFSAFHFDPVGFLARFELGVLFGLLAWRGRSVWPAIGAHVANNTVSTVLFFATRGQPDAPLDWWVPVSCFIVGNALLIALVRFSKGVEASAPEQRVEAPQREPAALFGPWLAVGLASFLVVLAVDWRGVALNVIDGRVQPTEATRKREDVKALRAQARAGDVSLDAYEALLQTKR